MALADFKINHVYTEQAEKINAQLVNAVCEALSTVEDPHLMLKYSEGLMYNPASNIAFSPEEKLRLMFQVDKGTNNLETPRFLSKEEIEKNDAQIKDDAEPVWLEVKSLRRDFLTKEMTVIHGVKPYYSIDQTTFKEKGIPPDYSEQEKTQIMEGLIARSRSHPSPTYRKMIQYTESIKHIQESLGKNSSMYDYYGHKYYSAVVDTVISAKARKDAYSGDLEYRTAEEIRADKAAKTLQPATKELLIIVAESQVDGTENSKDTRDQISWAHEKTRKMIIDDKDGKKISALAYDRKYHKNEIETYLEARKAYYNDKIHNNSKEIENRQNRHDIQDQRVAFRQDLATMLVTKEIGIDENPFPFQNIRQARNGRYILEPKYEKLSKFYKENPKCVLEDIEQTAKLVNDFKRNDLFVERVRLTDKEKTDDFLPSNLPGYALKRRPDWNKQEELNERDMAAMKEPTLSNEIEIQQSKEEAKLDMEIRSIHKLNNTELSVPHSVIERIAEARESIGLPSDPKKFLHTTHCFSYDKEGRLKPSNEKVVVLYNGHSVIPARKPEDLINRFMNGKEKTDIVSEMYKKANDKGKIKAVEIHKERKAKEIVRSPKKEVSKTKQQTKKRIQEYER